jgi:hypothetical protein
LSQRRTRDRKVPETGDVYSEDESLAQRFFGEGDGGKRGGFKTAQLCKQVERAASLALAVEGDGPLLIGAWVAAVEPAPDASRLLITVVLAPGRGMDDLAEAWAALSRATPMFRAEVARSISRKRVPELVWSVNLAEGVRHE